MRFLFEQNLSPRLLDRLSSLFPDSQHVSLVNLDQATDAAVWQYASEHGYTIVSRDADFSELSVLRGFPPRVIWIRMGNCSTKEIEAILRRNSAAILALDNDPDAGVLVLL